MAETRGSRRAFFRKGVEYAAGASVLLRLLGCASDPETIPNWSPGLERVVEPTPQPATEEEPPRPDPEPRRDAGVSREAKEQLETKELTLRRDLGVIQTDYRREARVIDTWYQGIHRDPAQHEEYTRRHDTLEAEVRQTRGRTVYQFSEQVRGISGLPNQLHRTGSEAFTQTMALLGSNLPRGVDELFWYDGDTNNAVSTRDTVILRSRGTSTAVYEVSLMRTILGNEPIRNILNGSD